MGQVSGVILTKVADGILRGIGLDDIGTAVFTLGETMPTPDNTGVPDTAALTPWEGTENPLVIDQPTMFDSIDFGNTCVIVKSSGVTFQNCNWRITDAADNQAIIIADSGAVSGLTLNQCSFVCVDQRGFNLLAIRGHDFTAYRCKVMGTVDGVRPNLGGNWRLHGCFIGFLGWYAADTTGVVQPHDVQSHSDCVQTTYGGGEIIGCTLLAYPSTVVGTGTPGSGSDTGNPTSWYTQAQAEARRAELMGSVWTDAQKSYGGVSRAVGGVITCLMCNRATGPTALNLTVLRNWFGGGGVQVNALASNLTSPLGVFHGNRHFDDSAYQAAGRAMGYRLASGLTADIPQSGPDVNTFMDDGATVPVIQ